jgi:hypothetical protein
MLCRRRYEPREPAHQSERVENQILWPTAQSGALPRPDALCSSSKTNLLFFRLPGRSSPNVNLDPLLDAVDGVNGHGDFDAQLPIGLSETFRQTILKAERPRRFVERSIDHLQCDRFMR